MEKAIAEKMCKLYFAMRNMRLIFFCQLILENVNYGQTCEVTISGICGLLIAIDSDLGFLFLSS